MRPRLYKTILIFALAVAFAAAARGAGVGALVRTTRRTPVFKLPMAQAPVLADVDPGVLLLVRKLSPRETWLWLEDEDGNAGWVPANRTDFASLQHPADTGLPAVPAESTLPDRVESEGRPDSRVRHEIALVGRAAWRGESPSGGALYSLLLPQRPGSGRAVWIGLQTGWLASFKQKKFVSWSVPVRVRALGQGRGSAFGLGPDFGATYHHRLSSGSAGWGFNLGYLAGWYGDGGYATLRAAVDFRPVTRLSLELALGMSL